VWLGLVPVNGHGEFVKAMTVVGVHRSTHTPVCLVGRGQQGGPSLPGSCM